jgi:tetratricopeptide (TPR) repeat protein
MLMRDHRSVIGLALLAGLLLAGPAAADDGREMEFVHRLQQRGYGDMAVYYLDSIAKRADLPDEIREIIDLERSNSFVVWAKSSTDPKQAEERLALGREALDKFVKEHPKNLRAASAGVAWGDYCLDRGTQQLAIAKRPETAPADRAKAMTEARTQLKEAAVRLSKAAKELGAWLDDVLAQGVGKAGKRRTLSRSQREDAELEVIEARFKTALALYHLGTAYEGPNSPERTEYLTQAASRFDNIYQDLRNTSNRVTMYAHLWHAKAALELGDRQTGQDILDELLAMAPENAAKSKTDLAPVFTEATLLRLQELTKQDKWEKFVSEADAWLQSHAVWRRIPAYQLLNFDLARAQIRLAKQATGAARTKYLRQALSSLTEVAKFPGERKESAIKLRVEIMKVLGKDAVGADDFLSMGDTAVAAKNLEEAEKQYQQAVDRAVEHKNDKVAAEAKKRLNAVHHAQAYAFFTEGKYEETLKLAGEVAKGDAESPEVARSAGLALLAAQSLCLRAKDKDAARERLEKIADFVVQKWPNGTEADDARIALGQIHLLRGDIETATGYFNKVKVSSGRYPAVLYTLAQVKWKAFLDQRKKGKADADPKVMADSLADARKSLERAVELFQLRGTADDAERVRETRTLLAEVLLECNEPKGTVTQLEPLVQQIKTAESLVIDTLNFRIFITMVRAYLAMGDTEHATETAVFLMEKAPDDAKFNDSLVNFVRLMGQEHERIQAALDKSKPGDKSAPAGGANPMARRDSLRKLLEKCLALLSKRKTLSVTQMINLGDLCLALHMNPQAVQHYEQVLKKADAKELPKEADAGVVRVRARLVGLLRGAGKFADALKQSDELIAKNPKYLEPRMTRAQILEDWGAEDSSKYEQAVLQWTEVRTLLGRLATKPPEFYEALYRTAFCLYKQGVASKDASKLLQAEQVLKSTLVTNSRLDGPDTVDKYNDLLKDIAESQKVIKDKPKPSPAKKPEDSKGKKK